MTYHATNNNLTKPLHVIDSSLEVITTNILIYHIQPLGRQPLKRLSTWLLGVVEALIRTQLLNDILGLLVRANTANNPHAFLLGQLDDNLANSTRRGVDPDGLSRFGLDKAVEGVPGGLTRKAERADPMTQIEVVLVLDFPDHVRGHGLGFYKLF